MIVDLTQPKKRSKETVKITFKNGEECELECDFFAMNWRQDVDPAYNTSGERIGWKVGDRHLELLATQRRAPKVLLDSAYK